MCNQYRPKLITTERDGKVAIWMKMPTGDSFNICDLDKKLATNAVKKAIMAGFERGYLAHVQMVRGVQDWIQCEFDAGEKMNYTLNDEQQQYFDDLLNDEVKDVGRAIDLTINMMYGGYPLIARELVFARKVVERAREVLMGRCYSSLDEVMTEYDLHVRGQAVLNKEAMDKMLDMLVDAVRSGFEAALQRRDISGASRSLIMVMEGILRSRLVS